MTTVPLELREIRGPSAVGGGWRRFLRLTWLVAWTDFKLTYFGSALGYVWSLLQPLMLFAVLYIFFVDVFHIGARAPDFPVILLMNIVLVSFFQAATGGSIPSVVVRESLVRKMQFPRLVIPLATVTTNAMNLALNLFVVVLFMLIYGVPPRATWLLLPVLALAMFALTAGCAMLLSALYVRYRDVSPIWGVISQVLFYASGTFIPIETITNPTYQRYFLFNPIAAILQQARHWMIGTVPGTIPPGATGVPAIMGGYAWAMIPAGIIILALVVGFRVFNRAAPRIAEEL